MLQRWVFACVDDDETNALVWAKENGQDEDAVSQDAPSSTSSRRKLAEPERMVLEEVRERRRYLKRRRTEDREVTEEEQQEWFRNEPALRLAIAMLYCARERYPGADRAEIAELTGWLYRTGIGDRVGTRLTFTRPRSGVYRVRWQRRFVADRRHVLDLPEEEYRALHEYWQRETLDVRCYRGAATIRLQQPRKLYLQYREQRRLILQKAPGGRKQKRAVVTLYDYMVFYFGPSAVEYRDGKLAYRDAYKFRTRRNQNGTSLVPTTAFVVPPADEAQHQHLVFRLIKAPGVSVTAAAGL